MRKIVTIASALTAIAACVYVAFCAYIAYGAPRREADYVIQLPYVGPVCEQIHQASNAHRGGELECQELLDEAEAMRQNPGLAARDGNNLTIFSHGKQTARLIAAPPGSEEFDSFTMPKVLRLRDPQSGKLESFADITGAHGEFTWHFITLPDGGRWFVGDASPSPDGRTVAMGSNHFLYTYADGGLTIDEWPSRITIAHFTPTCGIPVWQDATHFSAVCITRVMQYPKSDNWPDGLYMPFDAKVWRDQHGVWQMQATRWLKWQGGDVTASHHIEYKPTFLLLWLPHFTADRGGQPQDTAIGR